jgi:mycothiol system anti-sigma-R factor
MIDCKQVADKIYQYLDGSLTDEELMGIKEHLDVCHECEHEREVIQMILDKLNRFTEELPSPGLKDKVMKQINRIA